MDAPAPVHVQMDVVCACDEQFVEHTATMLCSLLENNSVRNVFFIHDGINHRKLELLRTFVLNCRCDFIDYSVNDASISSLKVDRHASRANYFRLLMPSLLPESVKKVLYLDSDLIVLESLYQLWDIDIEDYAVAATAVPNFSEHSRLFLPPTSKYFNSGVMLINIDKWRTDRIHTQVIDFVKNHPDRILTWDQDGLNAVIHDSWLELPPRWNVYHGFFFDPDLSKKYATAVADPAIVHFSGNGLKPWQARVKHPYKDAYFEYRNRTPWRADTWRGKFQRFLDEIVSGDFGISTRRSIRKWGRTLTGSRSLNR